MTTATSERTILIVDDDPDIVLGLEDLLRHDGYQVDSSGTCAEAIARVQQHHYNAVLLDLNLPDGDGMSVLKVLQEVDRTLPVIVLTACTSAERTVGTLTEGAFAYLTKPYHRDELRATLQRAIGVQTLTHRAERVEYELSESEERFRSLVESATDAIVLADQQGRIISWNRAASRLFGYAESEVIGQSLTLLMPERHHATHEQGLRRLRTMGRPRLIGKVIELHGVRADGSEFPIDLSFATWTTTTGSFYSGIIRDISERKRAEAALRESQERLDLAVRGSTDGLWDGRPLPDHHWSSPHTPVWWSLRFKQMLGFSEGEFPDVLESWSSRLHPDDTERVFAALTAHIERKEPYDVEYRLLTKQGLYHWFRARGQAIWDEQGRLLRMAGSLQCITDCKRA